MTGYRRTFHANMDTDGGKSRHLFAMRVHRGDEVVEEVQMYGEKAKGRGEDGYDRLIVDWHRVPEGLSDVDELKGSVPLKEVDWDLMFSKVLSVFKIRGIV